MDHFLSPFAKFHISKERMLLRPSLPTALALALLAIPSPTHGASILCAENLYGRPLLSDATTISNNLPYVKSDPNHQMDAGRIFAEPAFFAPKFQGLRNTWSSAMVQLPRVWRYRKSPTIPTDGSRSRPHAFRHEGEGGGGTEEELTSTDRIRTHRPPLLRQRRRPSPLTKHQRELARHPSGCSRRAAVLPQRPTGRRRRMDHFW